MKIIILAGGSGTRLWPVSRTSYPKQFLKLNDSFTLLQKTVKRALRSLPSSDILTVTNQQYFHTVKEQLSTIDAALVENILVEPVSKNTAPAITFAMKSLLETGVKTDETILIIPSDQTIAQADRFAACVKEAKLAAKDGNIVTFGVPPTHPETGYGYIQARNSYGKATFQIEQFIEKPDQESAQKYIEMGNVYWNAGIFMCQIQTMLEELQIYCPAIAKHFDQSFEEFYARFDLLPNISIDYAVMEKSKKTVVMPIDFSWSDVGSWDSVYDLFPKDENQNGKMGDILAIDTKNSLIFGQKRLVATIGLEDMLVIETPDAILVAKRQESQKVKSIVARLKAVGRKEVDHHVTSYRPWGNFTVLEESDRYKIKKLVVHPGQSLSLQMHYHRSEHWVVVQGTAKVTIHDKETLVHENESIFVPKGAVHKVNNPGKVLLEIIETQVGEYLGEDDIVRFDDQYGRVEMQSKQ